MSRVSFAKMVASGNDFILLDNRAKKIEKKIGSLARFAKIACERRISIGADGLLALEGSRIADIKMRIINPDGSEVSMCGNGSRCIAYYASCRSITKSRLSIETKAGILKGHVKDGKVKIEMMLPKGLRQDITLQLGNDTAFNASFINTGVPHAVQLVKSLDTLDVESIGNAVRHHRAFAPLGTNVDFVKVLDKNTISIRTYERGVEGETYACGTGAVASSIIASLFCGVKPPVKVKTLGGDVLKIYFRKNGEEYTDVYLEGGVKLAYEGVMEYV